MIKGIELVENNLEKSYIIFFAAITNYHDNWLGMYKCSFYGFNRSVYLTYLVIAPLSADMDKQMAPLSS